MNAFNNQNLFDVSIEMGMDNPLKRMKSTSNISIKSKTPDESHDQIQNRHSSVFNSIMQKSYNQHSSMSIQKRNQSLALPNTADKEPNSISNPISQHESFEKISLVTEKMIPNISQNPKLHTFGIFVNQHFEFLSSRQDNCFGDDSSFFFYLDQNKIHTFSPNLKKRKFLHVNSQNLLLGIFLIFRR
jgi:hypothetical protein